MILGLIRRGHDLQLYLHHEWVGPVFDDGHWNLRPDTLTVDSLFETTEELGVAAREWVTAEFSGPRLNEMTADVYGDALRTRRI